MREVLYLRRDARDRIAPRDHRPVKPAQQDLADPTGVTRESVNLALVDFRQRGLVEADGRTQRVLPGGGSRSCASDRRGSLSGRD